MVGFAMLAFSLAWTAAAEKPPESGRVMAARKEKRAVIAASFAKAKVAYPPKQLLLRSFKSEGVLELWAGNGEALVLVSSYPVCASSGGLGPKRAQGDLQVPEGFYTIDALNPWSAYHLSMHVDYPNAADRVRSRHAGVNDLGGDIMVHGDCVTIGCIPIEDGPIKEVYLIVKDAKANGARAHIHIFPRRLDDEASLRELLASDAPEDTKQLWRELAEGHLLFDKTRRIPKVRIDKAGRYVIGR